MREYGVPGGAGKAAERRQPTTWRQTADDIGAGDADANRGSEDNTMPTILRKEVGDAQAGGK